MSSLSQILRRGIISDSRGYKQIAARRCLKSLGEASRRLTARGTECHETAERGAKKEHMDSILCRGCLLIRDGLVDKFNMSFRAEHTLGRLSGRATVARRTRARNRPRLDSRGIGVARTKGGDRVCSDNQGGSPNGSRRVARRAAAFLTIPLRFGSAGLDSSRFRVRSDLIFG